MNVPHCRRVLALGLALVLVALVVEGAAHRHATRLGAGSSLEMVAPSDADGFWDCCRCRLASQSGVTVAWVRHEAALSPLDPPIPPARPPVTGPLVLATRVPRAPPASSLEVVS